MSTRKLREAGAPKKKPSDDLVEYRKKLRAWRKKHKVDPKYDDVTWEPGKQDKETGRE